LYDYIRKGEVKILGEPLPHKDDETKIDFDADTEFEFSFDVGLAPEINLEVGAKDKIPYYNIKVDKKELENYKDNVLRQHGEFKSIESAGDDELIKGSLVKVDKEGKVVENGIFVEGISMSLDMMKDDDQKLMFNGAKKGDEIIFDIKKAYPNDTEVASLLKINKEEVPMLEGTFKCMIHDIQKFEKATPGPELYERVYGEGNVKTMEEFEEKLTAEMKQNYRNESEYRFLIDARKVLIKKAKLDLPVEFLKRWMIETNENVNEAQVEEDFEKYEDDFRWQLIKDYLVEQQGIEVSQEEALEAAKGIALGQYMQYGISNVPDDYLTNYAKEMMSKPEEARRITDRKAEEKLLEYIRATAKVDEKEISTDKFRKLFE
jgi:trigger factor